MGKTIQAIGVINADPKIIRVLVICPASLKINWLRELNKWLVRKRPIGIADGDCFPSTDIVIINYDILHKWQKSLSYYWDLLIVDEAHLLKNPKTRRAKHVLGYRAKRGQEGESENNIAPLPAKRRVFLTGTPIVNKPVELWPLISSLDPVTFAPSSFFRYAKRYCNAKQISAGRKMVWDFSGSSNLGELQEKLRSTIMVRRLKKDVLKELPPKIRQVIELPSGEAGRAVRAEQNAWREHEDNIAALEARVELSKASDNPEDYRRAVESLKAGMQVSFSLIAKLRHDTAVAKIPQAVEHIRECLEDGRKLIVFAHHHDVINALMDELRDFQPVKVTGQMDMEDRQRSVDGFQKESECKLFIGNIQAAGVGLTLTAAAHVVFVELDWVPGNVSQAEDRAHRIGQTNTVLVQHLVLEGSLDCNMANTIVEKQDIIDKALDRVKAEMEATAPASPLARKRGDTVTIQQVAEQAAAMTPEKIKTIHTGLRMLAGVCDGAQGLDGAGFSKVDSQIGHSLAEQMFLSPKQAVIGARLVNKYRRQLPEGIVEGAKV